MRVWAFPSFYPIDRPGLKWSGIFAHREYKGLVEHGAEVNVIVPIMGYPMFPFSLLYKQWNQVEKLKYPKRRVYDGIPVYHPRVQNFRPSRFVKKLLPERYADAIVNFFKQNNITLDPKNDIFYSQWVPDSAMVQLAAKKLGIKSGVMVIGDDVLIWPNDTKANFEIFKKTINEADIRFSVAQYLADSANKLLNSNLDFCIAKHGVDYNFFKPTPIENKLLAKKEFNLPTDKIIILVCAYIHYRKGWFDLIEAAKELKKSNNNFILACVHAGIAQFDLATEFEKNGLNDNFIDIGEVQPKDINRMFNAADIFCLPSHSEGIANSVLEAMSTGLPVVTTNICGHPEVIKNNVTGILVPVKEPKELSAALLQLINEKDFREQLGSAARNYIVNELGNFTDSSLILYNKMKSCL